MGMPPFRTSEHQRWNVITPLQKFLLVPVVIFKIFWGLDQRCWPCLSSVCVSNHITSDRLTVMTQVSIAVKTDV